MNLKKILNYIINFIFPRRCVICDKVLPFGEGISSLFLCFDCMNSIDFIDEPYCKKCGSKIKNTNKTFCDRCEMQYEKNKSNYNYGFGLCRYTNKIKNSLHKIKYSGRKEYLEFYGKSIANMFYKKIKNLNIDVFIPVPIHKKRLIIRNYNQAYILATYISEHLKKYNIDIPVDNEFLTREKYTTNLNKLDQSGRKNELTNAFFVKKNNKYKNICIIDDIYTTGSTIENMSGVLKKIGVSNIYFLVIAVVDNL